MVKVVQSSPLYQQVKAFLVETAKKKVAKKNKLQSEEKLAESLGVSRATIREALYKLEKEGILTKRHGKGNYIHPSAFETKMRIDVYHDFIELIKDGGYEPKLTQSDFIYRLSDELFVKRMETQCNELVLAFDWLYYANNVPAILVKIQIPKRHLTVEPSSEYVERTLASFLMKYCDKDPAHTITRLKGTHNSEAAEHFKLPYLTPLLAWDEIFFDINDEKLCFNEIFFNPTYMDLAVLVKI